MRRFLLLAAALGAFAATALPDAAEAQNRRQQGEAQRREEDAAKKRQREAEWNDPQAPLPQLRNAGPCPFVKVLYDAARYVEFKGPVSSSNVGFTGEIQGVSAGCRYRDDEPIQLAIEMLFELGRGPQAEGRQNTYRYWVAVTQRNEAVLAKEYFDLPVQFGGEERVYVREEIENIVIPRGALTVSGANFEVLVGFDVTPEMAEFNRTGSRFRVNAGVAQAAGSAPNVQ